MCYVTDLLLEELACSSAHAEGVTENKSNEDACPDGKVRTGACLSVCHRNYSFVVVLAYFRDELFPTGARSRLFCTFC